MSRFTDAVVLVTGGSRGVGKVLAESFADEGARVAITYQRRERDARRVCEGIVARGGSASAHAMDTREPGQVRAVVDAIAEEAGRLDVVVANAAINHPDFAAHMDPEAFADVIDVNLRGVFHVARAAARTMLARGGGSIVTVGSLAALRAAPGQAAYAASKAGMLAFTRNLALELAPRGVRVNAVVGGVLDTGMAARLDHRTKRRHLELVPIGRPGRAEELAAAVKFLASQEASYVVGHALVVDGGASL